MFSPALSGIAVPGRDRARVSADDVSIFLSCSSDIEVVQKALEWYEKVTGTKINHNKSSSFRCLEGGRAFWAFYLDKRTCLHFWNVVRARSPTE